MGDERASDLGLDSTSLSLIRDAGRDSLYFFEKAILGFDKLTPGVHLPLCEILQTLENRRSLIVLPRGWFKTTVSSIGFPIHQACYNPDIRILLVQNTFTNALAKNLSIKSQFERNSLLRALFPEVLPTTRSVWKGESLCLNRTQTWPEGTFECAGVGTTVTSRHYDLIIEDDTVAPDISDLGMDNLIPTKEDVEKTIGYHKLIVPLLVDPLRSRSIVIGTRWFELDLISYIQEREPWYKVYERACREKDGKPSEDGEAAFPERFPEEALLEIEQSLGPYLFSCLYMNKPQRSKDMVFDPSSFVWYDQEQKHLRCYTTVDLATDPEQCKGQPDFNVVLTVGVADDGSIYVLEYWQKRANPLEVINEIFRQVRIYGSHIVGVESVAYQSTLKFWLKKEMSVQNFAFMVKDVNKSGKRKIHRIMGLEPLVRKGLIKFRRSQRALVQELVVFPLGQFDDLADALAMILEVVPGIALKRDEFLNPAVPEEFTLDGLMMELDQKWQEARRRPLVGYPLEFMMS